MSQFINAKEMLVTDAIEGVLQSSGGALTRLDGYPHIKSHNITSHNIPRTTYHIW